jgi:type II secretory pathway pseudopilin PulG
MRLTPRPSSSSHRPGRGFTLIETALATVIISLGVLGMMQLLAACTSQNRAGSQTTTALYLAQCSQEMLADLPFNDPSGAGFGREETGGLLTWNDIDDFHSFDSAAGNLAPIDGQRNRLTGLEQYSQRITVTEISPANLALALPGSDAKRVLVQILYRRIPSDAWAVVYQTSWIRTR